jgi:hypothetical protein
VKKEQQDRDSSLERLMRDALSGQLSDVSGTADTSQCLDTDTLAAWAEQTLSTRERTALEAHTADCARCQAMLAAMVRTTPVPVATPWWRVHMMAWMVPMTAGAAALIVWTMLPARTTFESRQAATQIAQGAAPPVPATAPPAPALADNAATKTLAKDESLREAPRKEAAADQARARQMDFRRANADDKKDQTAVSSLAKTEAAPAEPKAEAAAAPVPAPAAERDARAKATDAIAGAQPPAPPAAAPVVAPPQSAANAPVPQAPAAPPPPARSVVGGVAGGGNAAEGRVDRLMARPAAAPMVQIVSPNPSNRWRLLMPGGAVQHSTDGGSTWETQPTGADVTLTAGASPAPLVCWLIGPRGRVLLSRDGATWKTVSIGEPIDLVSIRATDDKSATVMAADGRTFATADGGATWTPR